MAVEAAVAYHEDRMTAAEQVDDVKAALDDCGWFETPGAYILVDGQFGSTGKGLLAGLIAEAGAGRITCVTTNAGPNSGHTAYIKAQGVSGPHTAEAKVMTQQMPIASVVLATKPQLWLGSNPVKVLTYLNAGAILDLDILHQEVGDNRIPSGTILIHPAAAVIRASDREAECQPASGAAKIASTAKGVGAALAGKINRECNVAEFYKDDLPGECGEIVWDWKKDYVFVETAQGFSLGINSRFYPHVTSRECTVMQAIADARIPCRMVRKVAACYRTYPIRVGNTSAGQSGDCYPDQQEIAWGDIGQDPEFTSVTRRVRRLFTWSRIQFKESVAANRPDLLFLNFANYLDPSRLPGFIRQMKNDYREVVGLLPELILVGFGPRSEDVQVW